jgi:ABC-type antimicrobial peptide transport system permease subunit
LVIGLALTVAAFSAFEQLVRNEEIMVNVWDPYIFAVSVVALTAAALTAMLGPALRATKIDPMTALRQE